MTQPVRSAADKHGGYSCLTSNPRERAFSKIQRKNTIAIAKYTTLSPIPHQKCIGENPWPARTSRMPSNECAVGIIQAMSCSQRGSDDIGYITHDTGISSPAKPHASAWTFVV